jgi:hypothetical protein
MLPFLPQCLIPSLVTAHFKTFPLSYVPSPYSSFSPTLPHSFPSHPLFAFILLRACIRHQVVLGGIAAMANGGTASNALLDSADITSRAAMALLTSTSSGVDGVLQEPCEVPENHMSLCNHDQEIFKGIFVRHLWCVPLTRARIALQSLSIRHL